MNRIRLAGVLIALAVVPLPLEGQLDSHLPVAISAGEERADSLPAGGAHHYTLDLDARRFVFGVVDQRTVDVVVTVRSPAGELIGRFDGPARGAERFQFDADSAGTYRLEITPFEEGAGRYALRLERVEPLATEPAARVSQLMAPLAGAVPGGLVAVVRDGELVLAEAYGMANLTHDVPFTTATRTNIGSTSKQFTAFAIGLLAQRGELSLDDDVREHIPELPDFGSTVTLRHLLTHTSGYREFLNTLAMAGRRIGEGDHIERDEIVEIVQRQPELQNEPGAEWNYNNTGYALLAQVVERVSGDTFADWMRENVFEPLGMEHTVVRAEPSQIVPHSAQGYVASEQGWREAPDLGGAMGAGGIYTTVADLARWIDNLETGRLGGQPLVDAMTSRYVLTSGDTTDYGLGLFVDEMRGLRRVHHGGADVAHRSMLAYYPERRTGVVVLSNNASFPGSIPNEVAQAFLGDAMEPEGPDLTVVVQPFDPTSYDPESFDAIAGRYSLDEAPSFVIEFFRRGDTLYTQATGQPELRVVPVTETTFSVQGVNASVTFHRDEDGEFSTATLHQNGDHAATRIEGEQWQPSVDELEQYAGRYLSDELQTFYTLEVEDGALVVRHRRFGPVKLTPVERDEFSASFPLGQVEFERDPAGGVSALLASNVRARGVRFERLP